MEYTHLGRSGLRVSRLCLGTMNFGPLTPPADARAIMDHAHEIGINFFDTANRYGGRQSPPGQVAQHDESHPGWTEEIISDWFAAGGGRRDRTVLLDDDVLKRLDDLLPGFRPAPEHYAW